MGNKGVFVVCLLLLVFGQNSNRLKACFPGTYVALQWAEQIHLLLLRYNYDGRLLFRKKKQMQLGTGVDLRLL